VSSKHVHSGIIYWGKSGTLVLLNARIQGQHRPDKEMIPKMIEAGTDIFRLNCSHRRGGDFERVYPLIRKAAHELGRKAGFALQLWIGILMGFLSFVNCMVPG